MKNKTLLTLCAASMLLSVNAMAKGSLGELWGSAYLIGDNYNGYDFTISDNCTSEDAFDNEFNYGYPILLFAIAIFIVITHRTNIERLQKGTGSKIKWMGQ